MDDTARTQVLKMITLELTDGDIHEAVTTATQLCAELTAEMIKRSINPEKDPKIALASMVASWKQHVGLSLDNQALYFEGKDEMRDLKARVGA